MNKDQNGFPFDEEGTKGKNLYNTDEVLTGYVNPNSGKIEESKANELISAVLGFNELKKVKLDGLTYAYNLNAFSFNQDVKRFPFKHKIKSITVPLNSHQDFIGNADLDVMHEGFSIGRGKVMYKMMIWHSSGSCTVYPKDQSKWPRNLKGNENITIHFKY